MSHNGNANKMVSDTPRTEAEVNRHKCWSDDLITIDANFACQLERELNETNNRIKRLHDGILKNNQDIEQTCGKVLGYPWFKDDQKNFLGATENDGVCVGDHVAETIVSELASRYTEALARIKRLEEAGDKLAEHHLLVVTTYDKAKDHVTMWTNAKDVKYERHTKNR